jgi:hypothetical protein
MLSKFIQFKIYTGQILYRSNFIQVKFYTGQNLCSSKFMQFKIYMVNFNTVQILYSHNNILFDLLT